MIRWWWSNGKAKKTEKKHSERKTEKNKKKQKLSLSFLSSLPSPRLGT